MKTILWSTFVLVLSFQSAFSQVSLNLQPNVDAYRIGDAVTVSVTSSTDFPGGSWVGLFNEQSPAGQSRGYLTYKYTGRGKEAELSFVAPNEVGTYQLRLFSGSPEKLLASADFEVIGIDPREVRMTILTETIKPGLSIDAKVETELEFTTRAWIGIYPAGTDPAIIDGYLTYKYISRLTDGIMTLPAPHEPGAYELRFFNADPGIMITRLPFRVGPIDLPGIGFSLDQPAYGPAEDMVITYTGHPIN